MGTAGGGSNGEDKLQAAVEKIVRWQNRLTLQLGERVRLREEIESAIGTVEDERLRLLLRYRYIDGWRLEKIAVEMDYDYRWIRRLHGKALEKLTLEALYDLCYHVVSKRSLTRNRGRSFLFPGDRAAETCEACGLRELWL